MAVTSCVCGLAGGLIFGLISVSFSWRCASFSTSFSKVARSCAPFTSHLVPPFIETFRSCLIVPIPLCTRPVARSSSPIAIAVSRACCGVVTSGSVAISINGMPSRSSE